MPLSGSPFSDGAPSREAAALGECFAAGMAGLGPFEPCPRLAVAVSGGADSMALAILARDWAAARGGSVLALVVDHGLRAEASAEAELTRVRLDGLGIEARVLTLRGLQRGPALAERARIARYEALTAACVEAGRLHLLLGHHAGDQAETLAMRVLRGSQSAGLAGMAALREMPTLRLLRPLLTVPPVALRALLLARGVEWVEDPSNRDERALRPRLRRRLGETAELVPAMALAGRQRAQEELVVAKELAQRVTIRPEGFAELTAERMRPEAMRALLRTIAGAPYPVSPAQVAALAAAPGPATIGGVRLMPAGRRGPGLLVVREEASVGAPVALSGGVAHWDGRFRVNVPGCRDDGIVDGIAVGKLGDAAAAFRGASDLPSAVLRVLPALWRGGTVAAVPHLGFAIDSDLACEALFMPPACVAGAEFVSACSSEL